MTSNRPLPLLCLIMALLAMACSQQKPSLDVPKRIAYPRVHFYDSCYVQIADVPVPIEVNKHARWHAVERGGSTWLNIDYPLYRASIYCTFTPVDAKSLQSVLDNRSERLQLNLGNASAEVFEFATDAGYSAAIAAAPSAKATPVQFLASNGNWVVSGAAFFHDSKAITDLDSVSPMVDILYRDIQYAILSLGQR